MELISCVIFLIIMFCIGNWAKWKAMNRIPPKGKKTDWAAMNHDFAKGMSKQEYYKKVIAKGKTPIDCTEHTVCGGFFVEK